MDLTRTWLYIAYHNVSLPVFDNGWIHTNREAFAVAHRNHRFFVDLHSFLLFEKEYGCVFTHAQPLCIFQQYVIGFVLIVIKRACVNVALTSMEVSPLRQ